jgi:hypothetical protein
MGKYDLLIKENLSYLVKPLAKRIGLNLENTRIEMIKDKLQYTVEREPDYLFKVCNKDAAKDFICQFDFQVPNDKDMPERMLFYRTYLKIIYKLPVKQIVFYLDNKPLEMVNYIKEEKLYFEYDLYDIRIFDSASFLQSTVPQEVMLAILCDYGGLTPEEMMEKVILRLQELSKRKKDFQKYAFQLHVLSGLRKLHKIFNEKIKTMALVYDIHIEMDPIYQEGLEKGEEKGIEKAKIEMVEKLLYDNKYSVGSIANLASLPEVFILSIQDRLVKEGKLLCLKKGNKVIRKKL